MENYYTKFGLNPSESNEDIQLKLRALIQEKTMQLQADPTDQALSNQLDELRKVLMIFSSSDKREGYDTQLNTREDTPEEKRLKTFNEDFERAKKYFYIDRDLALTKAAIDKAEKSYDQDNDQNPDYHYLKAYYYLESKEFDTAIEEISTAIVIDDEVIHYHILRLEIEELVSGKYHNSTEKVLKRVIKLIDHKLANNLSVNYAQLDWIANWMYFDQRFGDISHMEASNNEEYLSKARSYNTYLKRIDYATTNNIDAYEAYHSQLNREEQERRERERRARKAEEERLQKIRDYNRMIEEKKTQAVAELTDEYNGKQLSLQRREKTIELIAIGLLVILAVTIRNHDWGRVGYSFPFLTPIFGLLLVAGTYFAVRTVKRLRDAYYLSFWKTAVISLIAYFILYVLSDGAFDIFFNRIVSIFPVWLILYFVRRHARGQYIKVDHFYYDKIQDVANSFDAQKEPEY